TKVEEENQNDNTDQTGVLQEQPPLSVDITVGERSNGHHGDITSADYERPPLPMFDSVPPSQSEQRVNLRSSREAALALLTNDTDENWQGLLWALIAEDDVPAAYWLARALTAQERFCAVPDWLLSAVQGARWLSPHTESFIGELLDISKHQLDLDEAQRMLGL